MNILFLVGHEFLESQTNGGKQVTLRNYELLKKIVGEKNVFVCTFSPLPVHYHYENVKVFPSHKNRIHQFFSSLCQNNVCSLKTEKKVIEYANSLEIDLICYERSIMGIMGRKIHKVYLKTHHKVLKHYIFMENIEKMYMGQKVFHENPIYIVPFISYWSNEKTALRFADKIFNLNIRDDRLLQKIYKRKSDCILPITFKDTYKNDAQKKYLNLMPGNHLKLLFVGSYFGPNYEGLIWFLNNVLPELPNVDLYIVGKDLEKKKEQLKRPNVYVIGSVKDTAPYYYTADAMIMPIFYGGGMKVKTAEALMYGKTIFASNEALEGYSVKDLDNIFQCNSKEEFIKYINFYCNKCEIKKFNKNIRKRFLEQYETNVIEGKLRKEFLL